MPQGGRPQNQEPNGALRGRPNQPLQQGLTADAARDKLLVRDAVQGQERGKAQVVQLNRPKLPREFDRGHGNPSFLRLGGDGSHVGIPRDALPQGGDGGDGIGVQDLAQQPGRPFRLPPQGGRRPVIEGQPRPHSGLEPGYIRKDPHGPQHDERDGEKDIAALCALPHRLEPQPLPGPAGLREALLDGEARQRRAVSAARHRRCGDGTDPVSRVLARQLADHKPAQPLFLQEGKRPVDGHSGPEGQRNDIPEIRDDRDVPVPALQTPPRQEPPPGAPQDHGGQHPREKTTG